MQLKFSVTPQGSRSSSPERAVKINILKRPDFPNSSQSTYLCTCSNTPQKGLNPNLSLQERQTAYYKRRQEIFDQVDPTSPNNIPKIRQKAKDKHKLYKAIETTQLDDSEDDRVFIKVKIGDEYILGLVDSGANITCLGKNCLEFLKRNGLTYTPLKADLKTAGGNVKTIDGYIRVPIHYSKYSTDLTIFLAPDLQQDLYLGTNFIRYFQLAPNLFPPHRISEISVTDPNRHCLSDSENRMLSEVLARFPSSETFGLGKTSLETHHIDTGDHPPIKSRHYLVSPAIQSLIDSEIDRMLKLGVIEPSSSPWASPVTLVRKPNKNRLCLDFRKVNNVTVKLAYPIPNIDGILSRLSNTRYISAIDLTDAFWQVPLDLKSREKTAFVVPGRPLHQFTVMPFGLCNAPQRMMMLMDKVIPYELKESVFVYLDDLLVASPDFQTHLSSLSTVAKHLRDAGLTINTSKSNFCFKQVNYLGYIVGEGCLKTDPSKTAAIDNFPSPKTKRQVRGFLGLAGWYRRFIPNFSDIAAPLSDCLKGEKFTLTEKAQVAFEKIKEVLVSPPVLAQPNFMKKFYIQCDASNTGIGAVLFQKDDQENEQPIYYFSSKLTTAEKNYSVTERECLAVVKAVKKFRPYVEGYDFDIYTDHNSLKWLMSTKDLSGRLARWSLKLQPYSFTIYHRKGSQNIVPDSLSRQFEVDSLFLESTDLELIRSFTVDFSHPAFQSPEYEELKTHILSNAEQLPDLKISDRLVYHRTQHSSGDDIRDAKIWKLWVLSELRQDLLVSAHEPPNKAHGGMAKTLHRLKERFYWPYMATQVDKYIKSCEKCHSAKSPNMVLMPPLHGCFQVDRPFQHVFIDFLGPYPRTKNGHTKMFILLDQLTKFVLLEPMRSSKVPLILSYLKNRVFSLWGVPESILSDNGQEFRSKSFEQFLKAYGISLLSTAKHSPQGNSSERVNRSIIEAIRCYIKDHASWDENISEISSALRSAVHSTLKVSPYQALFGQTMVQHGSDYELLRKLDAVNHSDLNFISQNDKLQILHSYLKERINEAHDKSAKTYNLRKRTIAFREGQEVFCRTFPQSCFKTNFVAKFAPRFQKARVLKVLGKNRYELGTLQDKSLGIYHTKDIKYF